MPRKKLAPETPDVTTAPRKRGRPPKTATQAPAPVETPVLTAEATAKRGRGRPRKAEVAIPSPVVVETTPAAAAEVVSKRGRGRPKKSVEPEAVVTPTVEVATVEVAPVEASEPKRGRGRPKKVEAATPAPASARKEAPVAELKRGRGRPAKNTVVEPVIEEASPVVEEVVPTVETGTDFDLGDGRSVSVTFRSRGAEPKPKTVVETKPVVVAAVPTPTVEISSDEPLPVVTFRPRAGTKAPTSKPDAAKVAAPKPEATPVISLEGEDLPTLVWRTKGDRPAEVSAEAEGDEERGGRRRRRGRGRQDEPAAEVASSGEAAKPAEPAKIKDEKPSIEIPSHAPQVILRGGVPILVRDGQAFPPIAFAGSVRSDRSETVILDQIRMAAADGVHLHVLALPIEVDPASLSATSDRAATLLKKVAEADPKAQVILRVEFIAPRDVDRRYEEAVYRRVDGRWADPSVCDDEYWGEATRLLTSLIQNLGDQHRLMGVQLDRAGWHHTAEEGYDTSRAAVRKFRAWARTRYGNDVVALRAAWFDGSVRFDSILGPDAAEAAESPDRFIRSGRRQRRTVDYHLFLSDATAARIGELAYAVKSASKGCLLVGVEYGQTLEGSHPAGGHLALGKVLRTPEIDFVAGPPSYSGRELGGSAAFPAPIDSFPLNGKLYLTVEDYRTSLGGGAPVFDEPGSPVLRTPQALESVHWRGVGAALAHGMGVAWADRDGEGSLRTPSVWDRATRVREALTLRAATPLEDPEVAVFIDERALGYLVDGEAFQLLVQDVRESIMRAGVSAAFYLLSDLAHREKFPDSKLYVFLNAWDIRPELRAAIKSRLQRDNKVLFWIYAAGLFDAGRDSLERAREVTGIALKPQPFASKAGTTLLNRRHPLTAAFPDRAISGNAALEPTYFAIPEDATVLGEYTQTGLPSFVVREFGNGGPAENRWTSVFLGEPSVTPALVRSLAQMAGAHVWDFQDDVVHVRPPFLTVHCQGTGARTLTLPVKEAAYDLVNKEWASTDGANLRFIGVDGATHSFLVGPRAEIEHLLATDPKATLTVETLPARELNVRRDASDFDVPIMKLGEWIDSAEGDEVADEWFLRPAPVVEETQSSPAQAEEAPDQVGRRRRRRRGGRGGRGPENAPNGAVETFAPPSNEDLGISVVFRKRE